MGQISEGKKEQVWNSARPIDKSVFDNSGIKADPDEYRMDDIGGAIVKKSDYGKQTEYGWTIDHTLPISKGGTDHLSNLQVAHWKNNLLKGEDFPTFDVAIALTLKSPFQNIEGPFPKQTISESLYSELKGIYKDKV